MWSNLVGILRLLVRSGIACHNDRLIMIISLVFNLSDTAEQQVFLFCVAILAVELDIESCGEG